MGGQGYSEDLTKKPAEGTKLITEEMPVPGATPDPAATPLTEEGAIETAPTEPAPEPEKAAG